MTDHASQAIGFDQSDCPFTAGEPVSQSGLYEVCHHDEPRTTTILTNHGLFPFCRTCQEKVRYKLLQEVPHVSEDPDFMEFFAAPHNLQRDLIAANHASKLELVPGFRSWQHSVQAGRDSSEIGDSELHETAQGPREASFACTKLYDPAANLEAGDA